MPEASWKFVFYSFAWSWSAYLVIFSGRYQCFWDPLSIWDGWHTGMLVPTDIKFAYLVQSAFYVHSIYGTICLDVWRKDSIVMLAHHFITLVLISFSYAARYHVVGLLVYFLHDISDVALEFTKLNAYMKHRRGTFRLGNDLLSSFGFLWFTVSWYVFRLYWFPLKVLYLGLYGAAVASPFDAPFLPILNIMLWLLLIMHCYWFSFILILLGKIITGRANQIDDTREFEEENSSVELDTSKMDGEKDNIQESLQEEDGPRLRTTKRLLN